MIADFMGVNPNEFGVYDFGGGEKTSQLKYHASWDWLIPVVDLCAGRCKYSIQRDRITFALLSIDIKKIYEAVVQFIEWYNEQK